MKFFKPDVGQTQSLTKKGEEGLNLELGFRPSEGTVHLHRRQVNQNLHQNLLQNGRFQRSTAPTVRNSSILNGLATREVALRRPSQNKCLGKAHETQNRR